MGKKSCPTKGFERLLVATDGSEFSSEAVREAIAIAGACSAKLYALLVIEANTEIELWDADAAEKIERNMRKHLDGIIARAARAGVACESIMHLGDEPYKLIVDEAKKRRISTIVMGSHGRTGLTRLMMGSTASRVIGHAPCKVLVVPHKARR